MGRDNHGKTKMCVTFEIFKIIMRVKFNNNILASGYLMVDCFRITDETLLVGIMTSKKFLKMIVLPHLWGKPITCMRQNDHISQKEKKQLFLKAEN